MAETTLEPTIPISEIFGPTIQGEGALAGRPTYFLRVGGCDYKCVWCDTADAVLAERVRNLPRLTQEQISNRLMDWADLHPGPQWLTISGGNPGMYDLSQVVREWQMVGRIAPPRPGKVTVETQGSRWQPWFNDVDYLTISPKPPSSQMPASASLHEPGTQSLLMLYDFMRKLDPYRANPTLKVIVFDDDDYEFAKLVHQTYPNVPFYLSCGTAMGGLSGSWVPPNGSPFYREFDSRVEWHPNVGDTPLDPRDDRLQLLDRYRWLVEKAAADPDMADAAIFPQLHVLLWGVNTKGV